MEISMQNEMKSMCEALKSDMGNLSKATLLVKTSQPETIANEHNIATYSQ